MKDKIDNRIYYPMLVSQNEAEGNMSREEDAHIWKMYMTLSQLKRDILTDRQLPRQILKLQEQFNLEEQSTRQISFFIRQIFFGELQMAECEAKIGSMLTTTNGGDPNQARAIVEFIQKEILTIQPKPEEEEKEEEKPKVVMLNLPLLQALSKYENLGNQLITQERIRVKSQPEPVRPSLLYWLKYYRDELGIGQHTSVERGEFLFRSENGRKLSASERERVNLILKSVEENFPLAIDVERQEIIFPAFHDVVVPARSVSVEVPRKEESIHFEESPRQVHKEPVPVARPAEPAFVPLERSKPLPRPLPSMQPTKPVSAFLPGAKTIGTTAFIEPKSEEREVHENSGMRISRGTSFGVDRPDDWSKQARETILSQEQPGTGEISFSTSHVLPAEREAAESRVVVPKKEVEKEVPSVPKPVAVPTPRPVQQPMNAFHIRPVSLGGKDQ